MVIGMQFTAGVKHRVTCWLKADREAGIYVTVRHTADGREFNPSQTLRVGPAWMEVELEFAPPEALTITSGNSFTVQFDATNGVLQLA